MELSEAVSVASSMKTHYRAFEKLEEVLAAALAAANVVSESAAKKVEVDKQVAETMASLDKLNKDFAERKVYFAGEVGKVQDAANREIASWRQKSEDAKKAASQAEKDSSARIADATNTEGEAIKRLKDERVLLQGQVRELKDELNRIKAKLVAM